MKLYYFSTWCRSDCKACGGLDLKGIISADTEDEAIALANKEIEETGHETVEDTYISINEIVLTGTEILFTWRR